MFSDQNKRMAFVATRRQDSKDEIFAIVHRTTKREAFDFLVDTNHRWWSSIVTDWCRMVGVCERPCFSSDSSAWCTKLLLTEVGRDAMSWYPPTGTHFLVEVSAQNVFPSPPPLQAPVDTESEVRVEMEKTPQYDPADSDWEGDDRSDDDYYELEDTEPDRLPVELPEDT